MRDRRGRGGRGVSSASALLEKASAQLKGERIRGKNTDDDGLKVCEGHHLLLCLYNTWVYYIYIYYRFIVRFPIGLDSNSKFVIKSCIN